MSRIRDMATSKSVYASVATPHSFVITLTTLFIESVVDGLQLIPEGNDTLTHFLWTEEAIADPIPSTSRANESPMSVFGSVITSVPAVLDSVTAAFDSALCFFVCGSSAITVIKNKWTCKRKKRFIFLSFAPVEEKKMKRV